MNYHLLASAALVLAAASAPAVAQTDASSAPPTRAEVRSNLETRFKAIDSNGDGRLDRGEIDAANARVAKETAAAMSQRIEAEFAELDTDKNGQLSLAEFKAAAPDPKPTPSAETLQRLDANKDGQISFDEFGGNMLAAFDSIDADKDGRLSPQEQQGARR